MKFTKMQGAGNDFIILNNFIEKLPVEVMPALARRICSRRLSVGADGLMLVDRPDGDGDYKMHFLNADGSWGEMCGNGARCIARYGYEHGLAGDAQHIETASGIVIGYRESARMYRIRLNDPSFIDLDRVAAVDGELYSCAYLELGVPGLPHAVVRLDELDEIDDGALYNLGKKLRWNTAFPKGANVSFCKIVGDNHVKIRTFERGVEDFTLACGTGSGSVAAALTLLGVTDGQSICLSMPGGDLFVTLTRQGDKVYDIYLTGLTNIVAVGEIMDEDLIL